MPPVFFFAVADCLRVCICLIIGLIRRCEWGGGGDGQTLNNGLFNLCAIHFKKQSGKVTRKILCGKSNTVRERMVVGSWSVRAFLTAKSSSTLNCSGQWPLIETCQIFSTTNMLATWFNKHFSIEVGQILSPSLTTDFFCLLFSLLSVWKVKKGTLGICSLIAAVVSNVKRKPTFSRTKSSPELSSSNHSHNFSLFQPLQQSRRWSPLPPPPPPPPSKCREVQVFLFLTNLQTQPNDCPTNQMLPFCS